MGIITPTGLATDATTADFFADTLRAKRLVAFYDFENEAKIFAGVHNQFRFATTCLSGGQIVQVARLAFYTRFISDVPSRRFELSAEEVLLLNPNTGTLPVFRAKRDADITIGIYRRHPILIRDDDSDGNPWGLSFARMFDMANDSGLFRTQEDLAGLGAIFDGWSWVNGEKRWLPLYEAKMLSHYDHRFATYAGATQAQLNKGTLPRVTDSQHDDSSLESLARYWVDADEVASRSDTGWILGWRAISNASNMRTFVPFGFPQTAAGHTILTFWSRVSPVFLLSVLSSLCLDYVTRQKVSGSGITYFIVKQLAVPAPDVFAIAPSWHEVPLGKWLVDRVKELCYTSYRIAPFARDLGDAGLPFRWIPERREVIRAEVDAAMMHVYGLQRDEVEHVIDSFFVVRKYEERDYGEFRTKRLVLAEYDRMAEAATTGVPYESSLEPAPGLGPRHDSSTIPDCFQE